MTFRIALFLVFSIAGAECFAVSIPDSLRKDVSKFGRSIYEVVKSPLHLTTRDAVLTAGIVSAIALTATLDLPARNWVQNNKSNTASVISDIGHIPTTSIIALGIPTALYTTGFIFNQSKFRFTALQCVESFLIAQAGTQAVKRIAGRARPRVERGHAHFIGLNDEDKYHSFPSGDVTTVFSQASVLAEAVESRWLGSLFYLTATATCYDRLFKDRHWFSDTVVAAVWGTVVGRAVVRINRRKQSDLSHNILLSPFGLDQSFGLALTILR